MHPHAASSSEALVGPAAEAAKAQARETWAPLLDELHRAWSAFPVAIMWQLIVRLTGSSTTTAVGTIGIDGGNSDGSPVSSSSSSSGGSSSSSSHCRRRTDEEDDSFGIDVSSSANHRWRVLFGWLEFVLRSQWYPAASEAATQAAAAPAKPAAQAAASTPPLPPPPTVASARSAADTLTLMVEHCVFALQRVNIPAYQQPMQKRQQATLLRLLLQSLDDAEAAAAAAAEVAAAAAATQSLDGGSFALLCPADAAPSEQTGHPAVAAPRPQLQQRPPAAPYVLLARTIVASARLDYSGSTHTRAGVGGLAGATVSLSRTARPPAPPRSASTPLLAARLRVLLPGRAGVAASAAPVGNASTVASSTSTSTSTSTSGTSSADIGPSPPSKRPIAATLAPSVNSRQEMNVRHQQQQQQQPKKKKRWRRCTDWQACPVGVSPIQAVLPASLRMQLGDVDTSSSSPPAPHGSVDVGGCRLLMFVTGTSSGGLSRRSRGERDQPPLE